ncbi:MAG: murein biosynthesis integral membrane protein MurJ [Thermoanaerobaculia bacterium]
MPSTRGTGRSGGTLSVAIGIFCSRLAGLLRTSALGAFFGVGPHADVFSAALRLPNLLQNLLGEQTLSAAFIPVYSRLLAAGKRDEAGRLAGAVFSLLVAAAGGAAALGVLFARPIVGLLAAGFLRDRELIALGQASVDRYELAVAAVRWIFPMTATLVLSAWALGVRNSHGKFFLSYFSPVFWNAAIVGAVAWAAYRGDAAAAIAGQGGAMGAGSTVGTIGTIGAIGAADRMLEAACMGALVGGILQFLVQLPGLRRDLVGFRLSFDLSFRPLREVLAAFGPTLAGRGVVQLSSYLDQLLASLLAAGAVAALFYAQTLYLLPVSLFGMSVAAAALPRLARSGGAGSEAELAAGTAQALETAAFLNLPSFVAYLLLGLPLVEGIFQLFGKGFGAAESRLVYLVLAAYSAGLPASTSSRVLQAGFYARGDTRTPARIAVLRVATSLAVGLPAMIWLDQLRLGDLALLGSPGSALRLGAVGLGLAATLAAWVELGALRRAARRQLPSLVWPSPAFLRFTLYALGAALPAAAAAVATAGWGAHPTLRAAVVFALFGTGYLALATAFGEESAQAWARRLRRGKR